MVNAMIIAQSEGPGAKPYKELMSWIAKHSPRQVGLYEGLQRDEFVVLGPKQGPVEELIMENLP